MHIQEWMGIVGAYGSHVTDDGSSEALDEREAMRPGWMTDDSKEATKRPLASPPLYSTDGMTDDSKEVVVLKFIFYSHLMFHSHHPSYYSLHLMFNSHHPLFYNQLLSSINFLIYSD